MIRNSVVLVGIEIFTKAVGLLLFVFMANFLGPIDIGIYAAALAMGGSFAIISNFGFERLVEKDIGRNNKLVYSHFREISLIKLLLTFLAFGVYYLFLLVLDEPHFGLMTLVAVFVYLQSFMLFFSSFFRGIGKPGLEALVRVVFSLLQIVLCVSALFLGWGLEGVVSLQIVSVGVATILASIVIDALASGRAPSYRWSTLWRHLKAAAPLAGMMVILFFFGNRLNIMLLKLLTTEEAVGYYAPASRLFTNLNTIPAAMMGAFLPIMSGLYIRTLGGFVRTFRFTLKYLFIISAPIAVGTIIVAEQLTVFLFQDKFLPSVIALQILMAGIIISFWNRAISRSMMACNKEKYFVPLFLLLAVVNISANLILVPLFSYVGTSIAVVITQGTQLLAMLFFVKRYANISAIASLVFKPAICVAVMGVVVYFASLHGLGLAILSGLITYPVALFATRAVKRQDIDSLKGLVARK